MLYFHIPSRVGHRRRAGLVDASQRRCTCGSATCGTTTTPPPPPNSGCCSASRATVTGSLWAKAMWGAYWNWDPRETSIFFILLLYSAYLALRGSIDGDEKRARLSAIYSVVAFVAVPFLIFVVPRIYVTLHPDPIINHAGQGRHGPAHPLVLPRHAGGFHGAVLLAAVAARARDPARAAAAAGARLRPMDRNWVVLGVALLVWGLLFVWLLRVERRVRELEKR